MQKSYAPGWMDGWMGGRAGSRIAYSNQKMFFNGLFGTVPLNKAGVNYSFKKVIQKICDSFYYLVPSRLESGGLVHFANETNLF